VQLDASAQQAGDGDESWARPDGVANVDIDVEADPGRGQLGREGDSHSLVSIVVANGFSCGCVGLIDQTIVEIDRRDIASDLEDGGGVIRNLSCLEVDVAGSPA